MNIILFLISSLTRNVQRGFQSAKGGFIRDIQAWKNQRILEGRKVF